MEKIKNLFTCIMLFAFAAQSSAQEFIWAQRAGNWGYDYGVGVCTDDSGNIFVTGKMELESWFDDNNIIKVTGNHDIFLAKYDPDGKLIWVRNAGGLYGDRGHKVDTDKDGNAYIVGEIDHFVTFYGDPEIKINSWGSNDIFVAKYDRDGNVKWAVRGGGRASDKGQGIAVHNDAVYVTGYYRDTATFTNDHQNKLYSAGSKDVFLAKYDLNGKLLWLRSAGGEGEDEGTGVSVDKDGNVYVSGFIVGEANFSGTYIKTKGGYDAFLAKYDPQGNLIWVKNFGGSRTDKAWGVKAAANGNIYITGGFRDKVSHGDKTITSNGDMDIFVACFSKNGDRLWAKGAGGDLYDSGLGLDSDENSDVYITGFFAYKAIFGDKSYTAPDSADIFVAKYSSEGELLWVMHPEGTRDQVNQYRNYPGQWETEEAGRDVVVDHRNFVIVTGSFRTDAIFGSLRLPGWTNTNIFLTKIKQKESKEDEPDPTSIVKNKLGSAVDIYPNPTKGELTIQYNGTPEPGEHLRIQIQNLEGRTVYMQDEAFKSTQSIDLNYLSPGIYLVNIQMGGEQLIKKIVLNP